MPSAACNRSRRASSRVLVWSSHVPPLPLFGLSAIFERGEVVTLDASGVLALAYVVILSTLGGFGAWIWLLRQHSASTVAPFSLLVPVFGIASAWLFLSEAPSATELLGAGVVLVEVEDHGAGFGY